MKRAYKILLTLFAFLFIIAILPKHVSAYDYSTTPSEEVQRQLGFNPEEIPTSTDELKERYLAIEWGKIIANTTVIGPAFLFFAKHPLILKILMNTNIEITPTFLLILVLWFTVFISTWKLSKYISFVKKGLAPLFALATAIILAHISLYNFIASSLTTLVFSQEAWWARALIIVVACVVIIGAGISSDYLAKYIEAAKAEARLKELESGTEAGESFRKGAKEGLDLTK